MSFESSPLFKNTKKLPEDNDDLITNSIPLEKEHLNETNAHKQAREGFAMIYENSSDPHKRLSDIMKHIDPFFTYIDKAILPQEKIDNIKTKLQMSLSIENKDEFANFITKTIEPLIDIKNNNRAEFEKAHAQAMNESRGFIEINRLLSYGKSGSIIHIHAPAGKTVDNKITLYRDGMTKLAEVVHNDSEIKNITATSYIVAEHPGLFKRAGFTIGDVTKEFKEEHYYNEKATIKKATISREDFLQRFYKK